MMPYVGMPPSAIGLAFSDGNNVGSVRTFTSKGTGVSNSAHGVPSHAIGGRARACFSFDCFFVVVFFLVFPVLFQFCFNSEWSV